MKGYNLAELSLLASRDIFLVVIYDEGEESMFLKELVGGEFKDSEKVKFLHRKQFVDSIESLSFLKFKMGSVEKINLEEFMQNYY